MANFSFLPFSTLCHSPLWHKGFYIPHHVTYGERGHYCILQMYKLQLPFPTIGLSRGTVRCLIFIMGHQTWENYKK